MDTIAVCWRNKDCRVYLRRKLRGWPSDPPVTQHSGTSSTMMLILMTKHTIHRTNTSNSDFIDSSNTLTHKHTSSPPTSFYNLYCPRVTSRFSLPNVCVCVWTSQMGNSALCVSWQNRQIVIPTTMTEQSPIVYSKRLLSENWDIPRGLRLLAVIFTWLLGNFFSLTNTHINIHSEWHMKWTQSRKLLVNSFSLLLLLN